MMMRMMSVYLYCCSFLNYIRIILAFRVQIKVLILRPTAINRFMSVMFVIIEP